MGRLLTRVVARISRTLPLQTVLVVPFVLQTLATVSLVGYLSFKDRQDAVNDLAGQLRRELANRIEGKLQTYTEIPHNINRLNASTFAQGKIDADSAEGEFPLWQQIQIYPTVSDIYCGDRNGSLLGIRRDPGDRSIELRSSNAATDHKIYGYSLGRNGRRDQLISESSKRFDARLRPWFKAAVISGGPVWSEIYADFISQLPTITASTPVYSNADGSLLGVCATDVFLPNEMSHFLASLQIGKTGNAFILERSGQLVATSTQEAIMRSGADAYQLSAVESKNPMVRATAIHLRDHFRDLRQIQSVEQFDFKLDDKLQLVQIKPFKDASGLDWLIVTVLPEADFLAQVNHSVHTTIFLCLVALMLGVVICILTARWITRPIVRVSQSARAVADGNWDQTVDVERSGDLGELARSFNQMAQQIRASFAAKQFLNDALVESESRLKQFLEAVPVGIAIVDSEGRPYYANQRGIQLMGKGIDPAAASDQIVEVYKLYLTGSNQLYPTERLPIIRALHGEHATVDDIDIRQDSAIIPVEVWGTPVFDEQGNVVYGIVAFRDITERKEAEKLLSEYNQTLERQVVERTLLLSQEIEERQRAESALRQSEEQRRLTLDFTHIGSWNWNIVEDITEWNDNHTRLLGLVPGEVESSYQAWRDRVHPEDIDRVEQELTMALETRTDFEAEYRVVHPDGSINWLVGRARGIYSAEGQVVRVLGVILDISDRKLAEAASILEERNRMGREIHDTLAQSFICILLQTDAANELLAEDFEATQACLEKIDELARTGLAEAHRSVMALRPLLLEDGGLDRALYRLVTQLRAASYTNLVYEVKGAVYPLSVEVENNLLRIGQEALTNAMKYANAKEIRVELAYENAQCVLGIKDDGLGFEVGSIAPFSGFGLRGMRERARNVGARLIIQSQPGRGTEIVAIVNRLQS